MEQKNTESNRRLKSSSSRIFVGFVCLILVFMACNIAKAGDWVTYRSDITRSGVTTEAVGPVFFLQWQYTPTHAPKPAWPMPAEELPRTHSDNAYHVAVANGSVYFGSSVTNKVYSVDLASGKITWTFFTEGPVRFAPMVWNNRVYLGSDDGYVYCLNARDGTLRWKYRAGPSDEKVIGNGRMISLWPVRTSVLVDNGTVYFGAGVFPYEGLYICALNADDGSVIWKNDTIGDRSHELAYGGISPQSYLVASRDVLYVPSGRAMPAAFNRKTGEFLFYAPPGGHRGGTWALLDNDRLIAGVDYSKRAGMKGMPSKIAYDAKTGNRRGDAFAWFPGIDMALTREVSYILTRNGIYALDRIAYSKAAKKGGELARERKKLGKELETLRKKLKGADEETSEQTNQRIDQITPRISELAAQEKRLKDSSYKWHYSKRGLGSLIMAGGYLLAGGDGLVIGVDAQTGKEVWKENVSGRAVGLAAADGRLIVSTDKGQICCFGAEKVSQPENIKMVVNPSPYSEDKTTALYKSAAEKIINETKVKKGYCLVLDCGRGRLAFELAKRTELQIVGIENDPEKLAVARRRLEAAGLLGKRVVVEPWDIATLPDYFANLIVSDGMLNSGKTTASTEQINRLLRPYGGVSFLGSKRFWSRKISWNKSVRGELKGASSWTQQYGNPQNTACSGDELVKGPLGVLWFGQPGPKGMVERHAKAHSPVSIDGRLFVQGEETITAYDAYNGSFLWKRDIPGAIRARVDVDGGNLALTEEALYVAAYDKCYRLAPATGQTIRTYELPPSSDGAKRRWGFVSYTDGILFGVRATPLKREYAAKYKAEYPDSNEIVNRIYQRDGTHWAPLTNFPKWENYNSAEGSVTGRMMVGDMVFAMNPQTGELLWTHQANRVANITVTIGDGKILFAESAVTDEQKKRALADRQKLISRGIYEKDEGMKKAGPDYNAVDVRVAVCLNASTGKKLWEKPIDLTGCCGDAMGAAYHDGILLFFGCVGNHDAWRFKGGQLKYKRIAALSARNGDVLWSRPLNYRTRPLIVGDRIIIEPRACNVRTGDIIMRTHPITGKQSPWEFLRPGHTCAITSASASALFYRSYSTAFYDLAADRGVTIFGGIRPGCWLNMIPANGLLLFPEASSGCTCSLPLRCSLALKHKPKRSQPWAVFITETVLSKDGKVIPVKIERPVEHLAINFGAPADMKDDDGVLWFGYPNPKTNYLGNHFPNYGVKFDLHDKLSQGMGYFCSDFRGLSIAGTDKPWLFTSGCRGLLRCELPLIDDVNDQKPGIYTVRLGFKALPEDHPGRRIFDIKLQDKVVLKNFDILKAAGKSNKAVIKEFRNIKVKSNLVLELVPKSAKLTTEQAPVINFIKVVRKGGV